ncbi:MAG TPA: DUF559 domain-containing protein [Xanthobacteraceae bacterium]
MAASIEHARALRKRLTPQEVRLWVRLRALRPIGFHFRRQALIGPYIVDFACLRHLRIVEVDGGHHARQPHSQRDFVRDAFLRSGGFWVAQILEFGCGSKYWGRDRSDCC